MTHGSATPDLIDLFTRVVSAVSDGRELTRRTLELAVGITGARNAAAFSVGSGQPELHTSHAFDGGTLETVEMAWRNCRVPLECGETLVVPDRASHPGFAGVACTSGFALIPLHAAGRLVLLVYVGDVGAAGLAESSVARLRKILQVLVRSAEVTDGGGDDAGGGSNWDEYLERIPLEDIEQSKLVLLLDKNDWNITRVALLMGVTRRTVYLRLARYGLLRKKVRKSMRPRTVHG
jgi:hypothetical protein